MNAINRREKQFMNNPDIWNTKLGYDEIDFYKPRKESLTSWINEIEKQVSKLRFHPHWGSACSDQSCGGTTDWNAQTKSVLQKVA